MDVSSALALNALFEDETRQDMTAVAAILDSFTGDQRERLVHYLNDPIGVRRWVLNERAFFTGEGFPVVSRRAMLRLREARVAAAYGMLDAAKASIDMNLLMNDARRQEVYHALGVYADGVRTAFPEATAAVEPEPEVVEELPAAPAEPVEAAEPVEPVAAAEVKAPRARKKTPAKKKAGAKKKHK